jgi:peptidoglycan L-alanyl-D-glutamate endopeptidase CwlK
VDVVKLAIKLTTVDFAVIEGLRTIDRQKELFRQGKSKTMNSRHLTGNAVDLAAWVDGKISWDMDDYKKIAEAMKSAAKQLNIDIQWGGDWSNFKDGPHFQLSHKR